MSDTLPTTPADSNSQTPPVTLPLGKSGYLTSTFGGMLIVQALILFLAGWKGLDPNLAGILSAILLWVYGWLRKERALGHAQINATAFAQAAIEASATVIETRSAAADLVHGVHMSLLPASEILPQNQSQNSGGSARTTPTPGAAGGVGGASGRNRAFLAWVLAQSGPVLIQGRPIFPDNSGQWMGSSLAELQANVDNETLEFRAADPTGQRSIFEAAQALGVMVMMLGSIWFFAGCQTAGITLASRTQPAHLRLPVDADRVDATLHDHSATLHIVGLRSSPAILAQGAAAHDVENGVQGIIVSGGTALATKGVKIPWLH